MNGADLIRLTWFKCFSWLWQSHVPSAWFAFIHYFASTRLASFNNDTKNTLTHAYTLACESAYMLVIKSAYHSPWCKHICTNIAKYEEKKKPKCIYCIILFGSLRKKRLNVKSNYIIGTNILNFSVRSEWHGAFVWCNHTSLCLYLCVCLCLGTIKYIKSHLPYKWKQIWSNIDNNQQNLKGVSLKWINHFAFQHTHHNSAIYCRCCCWVFFFFFLNLYIGFVGSNCSHAHAHDRQPLKT